MPLRQTASNLFGGVGAISLAIGILYYANHVMLSTSAIGVAQDGVLIGVLSFIISWVLHDSQQGVYLS